MEIKKTPKADLENKKLLFTEIGLAVTLGLVLLAFEWTSRDVQIDINAMPEEVAVEEEMMPVTKQEEIKAKMMAFANRRKSNIVKVEEKQNG